jgi:hypothetical protein
MRILLAAIILAGSATTVSAQASSVEVSATIVTVSPAPEDLMGATAMHASAMSPVVTDALQKTRGVISSMRTDAATAVTSHDAENAGVTGQLEVITTPTGNKFKRVDPAPAVQAHKGDIVVTYTIAANA